MLMLKFSLSLSVGHGDTECRSSQPEGCFVDVEYPSVDALLRKCIYCYLLQNVHVGRRKVIEKKLEERRE